MASRDPRAEETMNALLKAITTIRSTEEFASVVTEALRVAFNDVSASAWRAGLEAFADEMERGLAKAHAAGIPPSACGADVTDLIMAARGMAMSPRLVPATNDKETSRG